MNRIATFAATTLLFASGLTAAHAATVPCEDLLQKLRDAEKTATLSAADKAQVSELETKGIERCNADDDKRADKFFEDALKITAKK
ncbi:hypothetical protein [Taklimakanibacter albus]|uniref:Uncharacterized protein n=1 Tax=Taklimakanibacter albus TaxID=2800327 RepID=A0ACC5RFW4_9HYPH|nr:hypothetical protein [Aestuariivirga sp. YIM B02566]MBK1871485.1 hypothetical protein [Aestuariivirga sp. YIM B02566]